MKNPVEVNAIIAELERLYPDALCSLEYKRTMSCSLPCAYPLSVPMPG